MQRLMSYFLNDLREMKGRLWLLWIWIWIRASWICVAKYISKQNHCLIGKYFVHYPSTHFTKVASLHLTLKNNCYTHFVGSIVDHKRLKRSVPLRPGEKKENSKVKILFIVWSHCVLQCFNSYMKKYQCSKLNTYLVTIFLSEWGYCVYTEIPLRLSPAPTFRALKNMSAVMLHFLIHIEWLDQLTL